MPEYPDITIYIERLRYFVQNKTLQKTRIANPFMLRTFDPPLSALQGLKLLQLRRLGKRIIFEFENSLFLVLHLMIAGRLQWTKAGAKVPGKVGLAALDFENGTLIITEASTQKRASLHLLKGAKALAEFDRGGLEIFDATADAFKKAITKENHTLKRTLTDPRILSGIGNAYSDEILHAAQLSPVTLSQKLDEGEIERLYKACKEILIRFTETMRREVGDGFPKKVTAFREDMAVHGKYGAPCPACGTKVQRIRYASNETNYCPTCQTGGKLLADRALSRLLKSDWPRSVDELEEKFSGNR